MKILIAGLVYGSRPIDVLVNNLSNLNYENAHFVAINTEGIANAMNEAIDIAGVDGYDAIAYLANDIIEPENWLPKKIEALQTYPSAGIVASSLDHVRRGVNSQHIISNWLLSMKVVEQIGIFNESMFPYGPIDLDYCERANLAGFNTYYVMDCLAEHIGGHASGDEYGYNKAELLQKNWPKHEADIRGYRDGSKNIKIWK
jgi:GT2 family glycosyltransferase